MIRVNFPEREYIKERIPKELIVLHHTVSSNAQSVINWWQQDGGGMRVATAFIVDKDGSIYQLFDEGYWAYHIGKGSTIYHNQRSIGIEIVNEGPLTRVNNEYYWFDGRAKYHGRTIYLEPWRNECCWAAYTKEQVRAVIVLCKFLMVKHNIPANVITDYKYKEEYLMHRGIASHHNLRPDKTDVSPAFNLKDFEERLQWQSKLKPRTFE